MASISVPADLPKCPHCETSLSRNKRRLECHKCGWHDEPPPSGAVVSAPIGGPDGGDRRTPGGPRR